MEVGVAGAGVAMGERHRDQAAGLDVADAVRADATEGLGLEILDHLGDGLVVQLLELLAGGQRGERPQGRERLRRRHGEVYAGDRGRDGTRPSSDRAVEFERRRRGSAELPGEELRRHLATDLGEQVCVELGVGWKSGGEVGGDVTSLEFLVELGRAVRPDGEGTAEPAGLLGFTLAQAGVKGGPADLVGERVVAVPEEGLHLRLGDWVAGGNAVQPVQS